MAVWHRSSSPSAGRRGFTLIEAVISMAVVSLMLVAALYAAGGAARTRAIIAETSDARIIASELLTEIVQMPFEEPADEPLFGRESGEMTSNRTSWDDVDDYDGWSRSPPRGRDGTFLVKWNGWTRQSAVTFVDPVTLAPSVADTDLKMITVTAIGPDGETTSLSALHSRFSSFDVAPMLDTENLVWVGIELDVTGATQTSTGATQLQNPVAVGLVDAP